MSNLPGTVAFWADPKEHMRGRRCTSVVVNRADNADKLDHKHAPFGYIALGFEEVRVMPEVRGRGAHSNSVGAFERRD